jgi:hypothetical protein
VRVLVILVVIKRGGDPGKALALLRSLGRLVELIGNEVYGRFETEARERLARRIPKIGRCWPLPSWTSDRVRMFSQE